jgi:signal transduction histidine kinase
VAFGIAISWERADPGALRASRGQTIAGSILLVTGLIFAFTSVDALGSVGPVAVAVILTTAGLGLIFGPWLWRLADQLNTERRERIRSDERADVAAHLHDSVLQTLALIQRTEDPKRMVTLARAQERELRDWLYDPDAAEESLAAALKDTVGKVEAAVDVPIELVVVGDAPMGNGVSALVKAAGEAMTNAAKHSGSSKVSVYAEVLDEEIEVYINDQGVGFDRNGVPDDRRGIVESIEGRMTRHGGSAAILSEPGEGTEVRLLMPKEAP